MAVDDDRDEPGSIRDALGGLLRRQSSASASTYPENPPRGPTRQKPLPFWNAPWPRQGMKHPGILHMYLHLMEMSPYPERALVLATPYAALFRCGPSHPYAYPHRCLCGNYKDVIDRNELATTADQKYLAREGAINFYSLYRCHNYHFKTYGAMFLGQYGPALEAAEEMAAAIQKTVARGVAPHGRLAGSLCSIKLHVYIRFGKWQEIIAAPPSRRPETLLRDHRHAALCQGRCLRRQFQCAISGKGSPPV